MTMNDMLQETLAKRAELQKERPDERIWYCGKSFEIEGVGKVHCEIQVAQGATTWMRPHFRRCWELNGKRIAAAKLAEIVGA